MILTAKMLETLEFQSYQFMQINPDNDAANFVGIKYIVSIVSIHADQSRHGAIFLFTYSQYLVSIVSIHADQSRPAKGTLHKLNDL